MKRIHQVIITVLLALSQLVPVLACAAAVTPAPLHSATDEGHFRVVNGARLAAPPELSDQARWITGLIREQTEVSIEVVGGDVDNAVIRLQMIDENALQSRFMEAGLDAPREWREAYELVVEDDGMVIRAATSEALFYGLVSLWQLVMDEEGRAPAGRMLDAPEFAWRGLMLDSARHMQSVDFIKRYLDWMALHKLNVFHWHLTDDQAWRLEIKSWPRLAMVGGFRVPAGDAPAADIDPATGEPRLYGGYYTQAQIREVVAHAARRFITVVPEIDVPGHATAAIAAYPELGVDDHGIREVPASWGIYNNVFNLEEGTFGLLEDVLTEIVELFPGPFIHLGGDEVETGQWEASPRIAERMKELGIKDIGSLQNYYVERLQAFLDPHGKRVIGWDEILQSDLPPHAVVMSWRGVEGAVEAAHKGHQAVLSPAPTLYLDHIQTTAADAPPGRGGVITTRDIYEFDPMPESLAQNKALVLGLQANLWTEHVRTEQRVAYMTWPRAAAVAELGWSAPERRDWEDFSRRLPAVVSRLQQLGVNTATDQHALYRIPLPGPAPGYPARREDRELELCSQGIVLALEDDAPLHGERESYLVDINNPCWIWRDVDLDAINSVSAAVGQLPFNFEIGEAIHAVHVEPPASEHGELRVRMGDCDGPVIADLSLEPATNSHAGTILPALSLELPENAPARADLCFSFSRRGVAPIWAIDWVELAKGAE